MSWLAHPGESRTTSPGLASSTAASNAASWEAETHRQDGDAFRVVESFPRYPQPLPQAVAAGIIERHAGRMHLASRRLSGNQDAGAPAGLQHRPGAERQLRGAQLAVANFFQQQG